MNASNKWKTVGSRIFIGFLACVTFAAPAQTYSTPFTFTTAAGVGASPTWRDGTNNNAGLRSVGITMDASGNCYLAEDANACIRQVKHDGTNWIVTTIAGSPNVGYADGVGTNAQFNGPWALAVDAQTNLYVAGRSDQTIRKVSPQGTNWVVTTFAGTPSTTGFKDATGTAAKFNIPNGVCVDTNGNVYVSDSLNNRIRKITPAGVVTTIAGNGTKGYVDGPGTTANFYWPHGLRMDNSGSLIVCDTYNHLIRKVSPVGTNWTVSTIAGFYQPTPEPLGGFADGVNNAARFNRPYDLALDAFGNIYVSDCYSNRCIRKITPLGSDWVVTTVAGVPGLRAPTDGTGASANFWGYYSGLTFDPKGNLYVADSAALRVGAPAPQITKTNNRLIISWAASGYGLEQSSTLAPGAWTPVSNSVALVNGTFFATNNIIDPMNFFRLR